MANTLTAETELAWTDSSTVTSYALYLGRDDGLGSFEVLLGSATEPPSQTLLKDLHRARLNKRNVDLVVGIEFGSSVWLYGPERDRAAITLKADKALRALQTCLDEEDTLSAYKRYVAILDAHSTTDMPGVRNRRSHFAMPMLLCKSTAANFRPKSRNKLSPGCEPFLPTRSKLRCVSCSEEMNRLTRK